MSIKIWTEKELFSADAPRFLCFIGRNGGGKSTILNKASLHYYGRALLPLCENVPAITSDGLSKKDYLNFMFNSLGRPLSGEKQHALDLGKIVPSEVLLFDDVDHHLDHEAQTWLAQQIRSTSKRVVISSHSAFFLNSFTDDEATSSFLYCMQTQDEKPLVFSYFSIPSQAEKLSVMGAGEAFVDTDLRAMEEGEIARLMGRSQRKKVK